MRSIVLAALLFVASTAHAQDEAPGRAAGRPLVTHIYTADAAAHVFDGRLCVYVAHDTDARAGKPPSGATYGMRDYHLLCMNRAGAPAQDMGSVLELAGIPWARAQLSAPDAAKEGDRYYLYFSARDKSGAFRIGVASSPAPQSLFKAEPQPIAGSFSIDPTVFHDDDDAQYMYFGGLREGQLEAGQGGHFDSAAKEPAPDQPALGPMIARLSPDMKSFREAPVPVIIRDSTGKPLLAGDHARRFFNGAWVHKYKERYYLSYATGNSHRLVYATSRNPYGPFTYRGVLLPPVVGWTTHASIVQFQERWYLFYHESALNGARPQLRSVKMTEIEHDPAGRIKLK